VPAGGEFYPDGTLNGELVFRLLQRGDDDQLIVLAQRTSNRDPRVSIPGGTQTAVLLGTHQPRLVCLVAAEGRGDLLERLTDMGFDVHAVHAGERTVEQCLRIAQRQVIEVDERLRTLPAGVDPGDELLRAVAANDALRVAQILREPGGFIPRMGKIVRFVARSDDYLDVLGEIVEADPELRGPALEASTLAGTVGNMNYIFTKYGLRADEQTLILAVMSRNPAAVAAALKHGATVGQCAALAVLLYDILPRSSCSTGYFSTRGSLLFKSGRGLQECGVTWESITEQNVRAVVVRGDYRMLTMFATHVAPNTLNGWLTWAIETSERRRPQHSVPWPSASRK
jgi:hypothetical protein